MRSALSDPRHVSIRVRTPRREPTHAYISCHARRPGGRCRRSPHPARTERIFEVTGTDRIAKAASNVYRTAGAAEVELLRDDFVETTREMYPDLVEDETVPQNIPGTRCWSGDVAQGRARVCLMVYGRYMAELSGLRPVGIEAPENDSLRTMSQRVAAQYVKFVRSEEMGLGEN